MSQVSISVYVSGSISASPSLSEESGDCVERFFTTRTEAIDVSGGAIRKLDGGRHRGGRFQISGPHTLMPLMS